MDGTTPAALVSVLTESLVQRGLITKDQLAVAEVTKKTLGGDLARILIKKGFVEEIPMRDALIDELKMYEIELESLPIDSKVVKSVPLSIASKYEFMPLSRDEQEVVTLAIADPLRLFALSDMGGVISGKINPVLTSKAQLDAAMQLHYRSVDISAPVEDTVQVLKDDGGDDEEENESEELKKMASGARVVSAINQIISRAVRDRASDIHIEPQEKETKVRYRLDGMLEERMVFPKSLHLPIVSRLKVMGGMDIAERRIPQDGRVRLKVSGNQVDLRVSAFPTTTGEKIVMRLLIKERVLSLEELGLCANDRQRFTDIITRPHGIFFVTGPTGSGKSSTLYAALGRVNSQERNIVSVEDPVENDIAGIAQAQVNVKAGMTFAAALRSILRQDPDIIMIGEVRDAETAEMAVRAALTGHLVFSTLHTNSAIGAVDRLQDMGVPRYLVSSSLIGVMAQRLVRTICKECREETQPNESQKRMMEELKYVGPIFHGRGCNKCRMSGYAGRMGIFEIVQVDDALRQRISANEPEGKLREYLRETGVPEIAEDGLDKVKRGITTIEEVTRVTQE